MVEYTMIRTIENDKLAQEFADNLASESSDASEAFLNDYRLGHLKDWPNFQHFVTKRTK